MTERLLRPSKIICIGLNYKKHAAELNMAIPTEPVIFLKPPTALTYDGEAIVYPLQTKELNYEAELAIVVGKQCKGINKEQAKDYIAGYVCANDVTARDLQRQDGQWTRAKGFDTFCPISRSVVTGIDPHKLAIKTYVNGKVVQSSNTSDMIFDVYECLAFVSQVMTLYPEDIILTGTPEGVGPLQVGDEVVVEIEGIGKLKNTVKNEGTC